MLTVGSLLTKLCVECDSELCLKNLNQLASIGLVEMDEDCYLLKPAGLSILCCWLCSFISNFASCFTFIMLHRHLMLLEFL